ncbi:MAG: hypothetical protein ACK4IX_07895, partial [Candidatus Sericytochromatia bacterium]
RYSILLAVSVICIDASIFLYQNPRVESNTSNMSLLTEAIVRPLDFNDVLKVNSIIDKVDEKVIIEKKGTIFTSNFGRDKEERNLLASNELLSNRQFWKPLIINEEGDEVLYYKIKEINFFNSLISSSLLSLLLGSFSFPLLFFFMKDIKDLSKTIEQLSYYLDLSREQMEDWKHKYEEQYFDDTDKQKEKLQKKIEDFKNKRNQLKFDLDKKNDEINSLKENINLLKADVQNAKIEKNRVEESKNQISKEKFDLNKKLTTLENDLKTKIKSFEERESEIHKLGSELSRTREILRHKENEISELKKSKISREEFEESKSRINKLESELIDKENTAQGLFSKISELELNLENQRNTISEMNLEKVRIENEINNLRLRNSTDKEIIEALLEEKDNNLNEITALTQKIQELRISELDSLSLNSDNIDNKIQDINKLIAEKDAMISRLIEEKNKKENELKEFTFDTLEKLSTLKRFEIQISDLSREVIQKNNLIDSLNTRVDVKDKIINSLNKELSDIKDNFNRK